MNRRMILMLGAIVVAAVGLGTVKFFQVRAAIAQNSSFQPPPEAVTTIVTTTEHWPSTLNIIGTVAAVQGVTVSADLPGIVESITFDSGKRVREGETLVRLDTKQERAQLTAAEAQRDWAKQDLERARQLLDKGVVSQAEFDRADAASKQADARVGEIKASIARKQIRAPFSGRLGIRQVNLGQYLTGGAPIVPLQSMDPVYVNFAVPQEDAATLRVGSEVHVKADSVAGALPVGRVTAINSVVDEATRNVQIQAEFRNVNERLRPGMFVEVEAKQGASGPVIALPASAISYAPYGNSVFVVRNLKTPDGRTYRGVEQQFVQLGPTRGDQIAVVSGLKAGDEVVTSGVFKLRNSAAVVVNNAIQPSNNPAPKPEDS